MNLRDAVQAIYDQHGVLTPELVVDAARPKNSPLHSWVFNKNQKDAAEHYYQERARFLIQRFKVTVRPATEDDPGLRVRKWHAVPSDDGVVFKAADDIAADPLLTEIVLRDMEREWLALHRRYGQFSEFIELVNRTLKAAS